MNALQMHRAAGMGAIDWEGIIGRGFDFGNTFLEQWGNRGAYRSGINPNAPAGGYYQTQQTLTPAQLALMQAQGLAPGSQISGGLSQGWSQLASTIGVSPGTLTLLVAGGAVLLFMSPPRGRR